jgi:ribosomal protein S12 methylthiotransferase accessory factor YcaO
MSFEQMIKTGVVTPAFSDLPTYAYAMHQGISGSAVANCEVASVKALGELIERVHILHECESNGYTNIANLELGHPFAKEWVNCWDELRLELNADSKIPTVHGVSYPAGRTIELPLMHVSMCEDACDQPFVDSSGCASHIEPELAIEFAIKEFIERQYFCAAWLTGTCEREIDLDYAFSKASTALSSVLRWLVQTGELKLLSLSQEAGYFVVAAFHVHQPVAAHSTGFAFGCAGSVYPMEALESAVYEMFSGLIYDLSIGVRAPELSAKNERSAQKFTSHSYRDLMPSGWLHAPSGGFNESIRSVSVRPYAQVLQELGEPYAVYCESSRLKPGWWIAKIVSPCFFVNIDTGGRINSKNRFFSRFMLQRGFSPDMPLFRVPHCLP